MTTLLLLLNGTLTFYVGRTNLGLVCSSFQVGFMITILAGDTFTSALGIAMILWIMHTVDRWSYFTRDVIWWNLLWIHVLGIWYGVVGIGSVYGLYTLTEVVWLWVFMTMVRYGNRLLIQLGIVLTAFNLAIYVMLCGVYMWYGQWEMQYLVWIR